MEDNDHYDSMINKLEKILDNEITEGKMSLEEKVVFEFLARQKYDELFQ